MDPSVLLAQLQESLKTPKHQQSSNRTTETTNAPSDEPTAAKTLAGALAESMPTAAAAMTVAVTNDAPPKTAL